VNENQSIMTFLHIRFSRSYPKEIGEPEGIDFPRVCSMDKGCSLAGLETVEYWKKLN
jgi:hypothetical protein